MMMAVAVVVQVCIMHATPRRQSACTMTNTCIPQAAQKVGKLHFEEKLYDIMLSIVETKYDEYFFRIRSSLAVSLIKVN